MNIIMTEKHHCSFQNRDWVMLALNSVTLTSQLLDMFWEKCSLHVFADGSVNFLRRFNEESSSSKPNLVPEYVVGDLDSISSETREYFRILGSQIVGESDQDTNDFEKCINFILESGKKDQSLLILGAFGGRMDQEIANFHVARKFIHKFANIILVSEENICMVLEPGLNHCIRNPSYFNSSCIPSSPACGILPLFGRVDHIVTDGFQWNLYDQSLEMGIFISSSNRFQRKEDCKNSYSTIFSEGYLLFTCEFKIENINDYFQL